MALPTNSIQTELGGVGVLMNRFKLDYEHEHEHEIENELRLSLHRIFVSSLVLSEAVLVLVLGIETPLNHQANLRAPEPKSDSPFHFGAPWIVC